MYDLTQHLPEIARLLTTPILNSLGRKQVYISSIEEKTWSV